MRIAFCMENTKQPKERCTTSEILSTRLMLTLHSPSFNLLLSQSLDPHSRNNNLVVPNAVHSRTQTHTLTRYANTRARTRSSQFRFVLFLVASLPSSARSVSLTALRTITVSTELNVSLATTYDHDAHLIQNNKIRLRQRFRFNRKNKIFSIR